MSHAPRPRRNDAGLRLADFDAAIFDLDGVVTRTARVHAAAWTQLFDEYLRQRADRAGEPFRPFDPATDYARYLDGKPRYEGVASFLDSRGITLPHGLPSDPPDAETVCGLGNRKNQYFRESLQRDGVEVYTSTVDLIRRLRRRGVRAALVSSSRNAHRVLDATGVGGLFDDCIDGNDIARLGLRGKPHPDLFLAAAQRIAAEPERTMVVEDAISGVQAGRAGGFSLVIGLDRTNHAAELHAAGADVVVTDLSKLHVRPRVAAPCEAVDALPRALDWLPDIRTMLKGKRPAVFLDYDGTLTPIVARPELAQLSESIRATVADLAAGCTVAIISGRDRADVERLVGIDGLVYAGSHGFDISGPAGLRVQHEEGAAYAAVVSRAAKRLQEELGGIAGALVEPKRLAVAVHYRQVAEADKQAVEDAVDRTLEAETELRKTYGKKVFELRPRLDWDKGKAVLWVLAALGLEGADVLPIYIGDDITDEDAFAVLAEGGVGILVGCPAHESAARYLLDRPSDVERFLGELSAMLGGQSDA